MITGSEPDTVAEARSLLDAQGRDPRVAAVLDCLENELAARLRTLPDDRSYRTLEDLATARDALLLRMARRYRRPGSQRRHPAAALMLATVHRVGGGRLRVI
ncbi:hypothetical protein [Micromonospora sp. CPCC 206061]|uniref:hypothetical protein n=1 Tax=Micromonospora sp. CPCC 206061 TaxID=3122410 RepID=UPI002FF110D7